MKKNLIKLSLVAMVAGTSLMAGTFNIGVGGENTGIDGTILYDGTVIDLHNDLGLTDNEKTVVPKISYTKGNHTFSVNYTHLKYTGNSTLNRNITFDNYTYAVAIPIHTELKTDWYKAGYRYDTYNNYNLDLKLGTDINVIDYEASIGNSLETRTDSRLIGFPTLATDLKYSFTSNVSLEGDFSYLPLFSHGHYFEYSTKLAFNFDKVKPLTFDLGYQYKNIDIYDDTEAIDVDWSGVTASINYKF